MPERKDVTAGFVVLIVGSALLGTGLAMQDPGSMLIGGVLVIIALLVLVVLKE